MQKKILITGGAGFIGSHLVDELITLKNHEITVLDSLEEQVHGKTKKPPTFLNDECNFICGSILDYSLMKELLKNHEIVYHLAAMVGVGQSMYEIKKYTDTNIQGTANLLNILANEDHSVEKLIIASSNTIYGEGKSSCPNCGIIYPKLRNETQLLQKQWDLTCPTCGSVLKPEFTDESTPFNPSSVYALSKQVQEQMSLLIGKTYGINTTILRFFLVYGSRQSLSNPYTGVCAIFASRLLNNKPPIVFEDGLQTRDFVHVKDICQGLILAMEKEPARGQIFNLGSGIPITIKKVAEIMTKKINPKLSPIYNQNYRIGDIRHCVADISKAKKVLGYKPLYSFEKGVDDLIEWIQDQASLPKDVSNTALKELSNKGLIR
ncbi:MAG: NAD-dependent epimerase/dehydratase family protein [Promethearchaeota archaeon]